VSPCVAAVTDIWRTDSGGFQREHRTAAKAAAQQALREQQRAAAWQRRLDELAHDPETARADAERLISTKLPAHYDVAVTLLRDLQELAQHEDQAEALRARRPLPTVTRFL
jgi:transketolase